MKPRAIHCLKPLMVWFSLLGCGGGQGCLPPPQPGAGTGSPSTTLSIGGQAEAAYRSDSWVRTGGPIGGLGYDIRMKPDQLDTMYVTDDGAGAFKSTDGGLTWKTINEGLTVRVGPSGDGYSVFCLRMDPNNYDRLWLGTAHNSAIFRSDDAGRTWARRSRGIRERHLTIRGFGVEPGNSNVVYFAAELSSFEWNGSPIDGADGLDKAKGVVYKSVDAGRNWTRIWKGDALARYVLIDPTDTDTVFVSTGIFDRNAANSSAATGDPGGVGVLRSRDAGATWQVLDDRNGFDARELHIGSLAMHPTNPDILLAGAGIDTFQIILGKPLGGVYLTEDGGDTWTEVLDKGDIGAVEFCRSNPRVCYAASIEGVYQSLDGGHTWTERVGKLWGTDGVAAGFPIDAQCDPRDPQRLFVNSYLGGNFLSRDGGRTWVVASKGYTGAAISDVAVSHTDARRVYAVSRTGVFTSPDGGATWKGIGHGLAHNLEGIGVSVDPSDDRHVIARLGDAGPYPLETTDAGRTWSVMPVVLPVGVGKVVFSPQDKKTLFGVGVDDPGGWRGLHLIDPQRGPGRGLAVSRDLGKTWSSTAISTGNVLSVVIAKDRGGPMYVSVLGKGIYRSLDHGRTLTLVNADPLGTSFRGSPHPVRPVLALDPTDSRRLYGGFWQNGIFVSADGGATWTSSQVGMNPGTTVLDLAVDPVEKGVVYAAARGAGVYVSTDGARSWRPHLKGLTNRAVFRLALSADGGVLYAGTEGGGVFRLGKVR